MRSEIAVAGQRRLQRVRRDLAGVALQTRELQAAAKEFRRAALVGSDVGFDVTEHDAPGRAKLRQRQRVRRRAGGNEKHRDIVLKNFREPPLDGLRPVVIAVAARIAVIGLRDGVENGGRHRRRVVAGKIHVAKAVKRPDSWVQRIEMPGRFREGCSSGDRDVSFDGADSSETSNE